MPSRPLRANGPPGARLITRGLHGRGLGLGRRGTGKPQTRALCWSVARVCPFAVVQRMYMPHLHMALFGRVACGVLSCADGGGYQPPRRVCKGGVISEARPSGPRAPSIALTGSEIYARGIPLYLPLL